MSNRGRLILRFGAWTAAYGTVAAVLVLVTAIKTCGVTPDSFEQCDLTTLTIVQVAIGLGYVVLAFHFYRTRASGRL